MKTFKWWQALVRHWCVKCFGVTTADDVQERSARFCEEALELVQACGMSKADVLAMVNYTYGRPVGRVPQEVGGAMVTLTALVSAHGLDLEKLAMDELESVAENIDLIRQKHASKPRNSPLPGDYPK